MVRPRSNTVDRLSPASCRRQRRPQSAEVTSTADSPATNPNPRRNFHPEAAMLPTGAVDDRTDLVLIGASILVLLPATQPATPQECSLLPCSYSFSYLAGTQHLPHRDYPASVLVLLLLVGPTSVVGQITAMRTGRSGGPSTPATAAWNGSSLPVSVEWLFSLQVLAYVTALLRPLIYYVSSRTLRQSLVARLRCRQRAAASNR